MSSTRLEGPLGERQHREAEVDLPPLELIQQLAVGSRLGQQRPRHPAARSHEAPHHGRQDPCADALIRPDTHTARSTRRERLEVGPGGLHAGDDPLGVAQQHGPRLGHRDLPRPARALDETLTDGALERRDLLGDRRLRVAEPGGGSTERALMGHRAKRGQVAHLDPEPSIAFHDRIQR